MTGSFVVLRNDLAVLIPGERLRHEAVREMTDYWAERVKDCRIVVFPEPLELLDLRDADSELIELAERLAVKMAAAG